MHEWYEIKEKKKRGRPKKGTKKPWEEVEDKFVPRPLNIKAILAAQAKVKKKEQAEPGPDNNIV